MNDTTTRATRTPSDQGSAQERDKASAPAMDRSAAPGHGKLPMYEHIAADLREQIASGQLPPASLLPSLAELVERYGVSKVTARNAIATLRTQGLVTVMQGRGAFVRPTNDRPSHTHTRTITHTTHGADTIYTDTDTDADRWREIETSTYQINATPTLALAAGVAEHTPLFGYDRLLEDPAGRRILHRLYVPFSTAVDVPELENDPFIPAGQLYTHLTAAGHQLALTDYITARIPPPDDAEALRVPAGTPIISTRRITRDTATGQTLAMEETHRNADDTALAYQPAVQDA